MQEMHKTKPTVKFFICTLMEGKRKACGGVVG
jgi:hypothetical protein